jgi:hypothetical protein
LFELVRSGVDGVNLHARVFSINAPFFFTRRGLRSRPLLYGMILFKRMLGPRARLVSLLVRGRGARHLKVWAVREGPNTLNVLVINKGDRSATVSLHLPATGPAAVQRLLAPSAAARAHVTLDGQRLDDRVQWRGRARTEAIAPSAGVYSLRVRRQSAAMVTVTVAPGALRG